jgi:hypothetical protein
MLDAVKVFFSPLAVIARGLKLAVRVVKGDYIG